MAKIPVQSQKHRAREIRVISTTKGSDKQALLFYQITFNPYFEYSLNLLSFEIMVRLFFIADLQFSAILFLFQVPSNRFRSIQLTKSGIPESIIRKVPAVTEDTVLEDLFPIVSENPYPIPVVDEKGRFKGRVTTDQIFESISTLEGDDNV